jgi:hypothetical protein
MRWKIFAAENLGATLKSDNAFIEDRTTSGRFVQVRFEMENLSKDLAMRAFIRSTTRGEPLEWPLACACWREYNNV